MRVTVLCFARLRDLAGVREWSCELPADATVRDAWQALVTDRPAVAIMSAALSCAVNADFATMDTPVTNGDEIAFLPPVSGGAPAHP
jgi:molybdopterin converting factor subunit 1